MEKHLLCDLIWSFWHGRQVADDVRFCKVMSSFVNFHNKAPQLEGLEQQRCSPSQLWRTEGWGQGTSGLHSRWGTVSGLSTRDDGGASGGPWLVGVWPPQSCLPCHMGLLLCIWVHFSVFSSEPSHWTRVHSNPVGPRLNLKMSAKAWFPRKVAHTCTHRGSRIETSAYSSGGKMATHSSVLAWEIPWREEPVGYSLWGHKESDTT